MSSWQSQQQPLATTGWAREAPAPRSRPVLSEHHQQQQHHYDEATATPVMTGPTGAGTLDESCSVTAVAAPRAPTAAGGPVLRFHRRPAASAAGELRSTSSLSMQQAPPLLCSKTSGQVYVMLESIVGMEHAKPDVQVLLAAPIVVLNRNKAPAAAAAATNPPNGDDGARDVLFHPHPTKRVVIKRIALSLLRALRFEADRGGPIGEVKALSLLARSPEHPNVMPLLDSFRDARTDSLYLVMPYADGGELFALAAEWGRGLPEHETRKYLTQIVAGLLHLKRHGLAHGDVSLENVMLVKDRFPASGPRSYSCRLIDLGLARRTLEPAGTPLEGRLMGGKGAYVAPEVANGTVRDWHAADVWSLGVCLYNLCTGFALYSHPRDPAFKVLATEAQGARRLLRHHVQQHGVQISPVAAHLVAAMLSPDPARRPTYEQILQHPWVLGGEEWEWEGR